MKVTHICLLGPYTDGWSYQENLLPKYHKKLGHDVSIITNCFSYNKKGELVENSPSNYKDENGIVINRIGIKIGKTVNSKLKKYNNLYNSIKNENPDILFIHGVQFLDILEITKYLSKEKKIRVFVDNHADNENSAKNFFSKFILHKIIWKYMAKKIEPYCEKIYGVTPARVDFMNTMYNIKKEKLKLLVLGADDEKVVEAEKTTTNMQIRERNNIKPNDFLVITGGKIDDNKIEILDLMKAVNNIKYDSIKLIVFGSVSPKYKDSVSQQLSEYVKYIGWVDSNETYNYFNEANLVVFPGLHSVFWEQVVGLGKPSIFKYIKGFEHVDLGGNVEFLYESTVEELEEKIKKIAFDKTRYNRMTEVAIDKGKKEFSYLDIARRSIE